MHITYLIAADGNPLYDGKHREGGRYHTYGQHTFVLDLVRALCRGGHEVRLVVDDVDCFPLTSALRELSSASVTQDTGSRTDTDLLLVDEAADEMLARFPEEIPAFRIVHHAGRRSSPGVVGRCARFLCMTENSLSLQGAYLPPDRPVLIHQGVDLYRFPPVPARPVGDRPRVLVHGRMDSGREAVLGQVMEHLDRKALLVYALGDGPGFWAASDRFGAEMILINHVPCHSMPNLLSDMDVVISLGRGAMEAMATGIPTLCAGYGYAGLITEDTIGVLMRHNLTGAHCRRDPARVMEDVHDALDTDRHEVRALAERWLSADAFVERVCELYADVVG
ncbi:hypothetical protein [Streptomyces sp. NPDC005423]|uniref:hypothetical protein n=1 Tax=Streptomyces sp. NPDC005423 TaxID=3155343 RepID=UPI00339EB299